MTLRDSLITRLEAASQEIIASKRSIGLADAEKLQSIWATLQESEALMVKVLDAENDNQIPDVGGLPGNIEFGPALHVLNDLPDAFALITRLLRHLGMPRSDISSSQWSQYDQRLKQQGYFAGDGTLLQGDGSLDFFHKYVQLDPGWAISAFEYIAYQIDLFGKFDIADFNTSPKITTIKTSEYNQLKIAIVGDWGTGKWRDGNQPECPSQLVINQLINCKPDVVIHLGDVYYAGEEGIISALGEENLNFVDLWPTGIGYSFTLNSNHEMYGGAKGYFDVALASDAFKPHQGDTSYFAIEYGDWLLLGLDSAYYDSSLLRMKGALYDEAIPKSLEQKKFIQACVASARAKKKKIIVMTHHNPIDVDGTLPKAGERLLWDQLTEIMGETDKPGYPDYWYWGHVHNGIAYSGQAASRSPVKCRCVGHGSIPFANGYELVASLKGGLVDYYAHTPMTGSNEHPLTEQQKLRVLNGFATITLQGDALIEAFYETGSPMPVWPVLPA